MNNDKYRKVVLDSEFAKDGVQLDFGELTIGRIVDIDLNGCDILGNITIDTKTAADAVTITNTNLSRTATIKGGSTADNSVTLTINTPYADAVLANEFVKVEANTAAKDGKALDIKGVRSETFKT